MIVRLYDPYAKKWKPVEVDIKRNDVYGGHVPPAIPARDLSAALELEDYLNRKSRRPVGNQNE